MECNKEEALRAKDISQKKMEARDFLGARKFALKAQQLHPEVENISQMICVCDVHCSAESKVFGSELDWYGILQIEHSADDTLIKKQYRKLALLLHPDKNKFSGAEAAFKLIGEAQRVLLDKEKRSFYDMKCRTSCKPMRQNQPHQQAGRSHNVGKTSRVQNNFTNTSHGKGSNATHNEPKKQTQSGAANGRETFWTQCPFCSVRYQYYKEVLNRALRCQSCKKPFIAYDMLAQGTRPGSDATQPVFPGQKNPNLSTSKAGSEALNEKHASNPGFQAGQSAEVNRSPKSRRSHKVPDKMDRHVEQGSKSSRKVNGKRGKKQDVESSESLGSDSSLESEDIEIDADILKAQQFDSDGDNCTRRSRRNKRHVSYNEDASDDEENVNPSKKAKESEPSCPTTEENVGTSEKRQQADLSNINVSASATVKESKKGECSKFDGSETVDESTEKNSEADNGSLSSPSLETTPEPMYHQYPDPEFFDFDKYREEQCFKVGQVWAAYDTADAMPRFYAKIRRIYSPGFKLRITWLEPDPVPDDACGNEWAESELPFSCGFFKYGHSENTEDRLMFSHEVSWDKGGGKDSVKIYPKKGETWALFKNWDAKWYLKPDRKFEYEFAEILSEYDEMVGIRVAQLGKLKGFASLFCRKGESEKQIPRAELLRFSHRVPSYKMSGKERKDVPKDSFELDPASLTVNLEEFSLPQSNGNTCSVSMSAKFEGVNPGVKAAEKLLPSYRDNGKVNQVALEKNLNGDANAEDIPDPEFYNFDDQKTVKMFQVNQVWALYSDFDSLPKYYGVIKKIDPLPLFKVKVGWLEACYLPSDIIVWKEKEMPITCGLFKLKVGKVQTYTDNKSFSHLLRADPTEKKTVFAIYPRKGEIWALYRNWNSSMKIAELQNCDYDIVEVLDENDSHFKVLVLERVNGFRSVFKPRKNDDFAGMREISRNELLRFSHQIPSFRLTDEKGGSLRGFWELDPAAFPTHLLYKL